MEWESCAFCLDSDSCKSQSSCTTTDPDVCIIATTDGHLTLPLQGNIYDISSLARTDGNWLATDAVVDGQPQYEFNINFCQPLVKADGLTGDCGPDTESVLLNTLKTNITFSSSGCQTKPSDSGFSPKRIGSGGMKSTNACCDRVRYRQIPEWCPPVHCRGGTSTCSAAGSSPLFSRVLSVTEAAPRKGNDPLSCT